MRAALWAAAAVSVFGLAASGCSVFGARDTPMPDYTVLSSSDEGSIEVRQYDEMIYATTRVEGAPSYRKASNEGFRRLARYIFGDNVGEEDIGMTAPVVQEQGGEDIGMTAPVVQNAEREGEVWVMSFIMPERYTMETLPKPVDPQVEVELVPGRTVAALRFSGRVDARRITEREEQLLKWVRANGYEAIREPQVARYDGPSTLPMFRRN
ncbi:MAG: heme-binding protein, partial [Myxococcota bacterium]